MLQRQRGKQFTIFYALSTPFPFSLGSEERKDFSTMQRRAANPLEYLEKLIYNFRRKRPDLTPQIDAVVARFTVDGKPLNDDTIISKLAELKKYGSPPAVNFLTESAQKRRSVREA
jgi:hypothetical protein